MAGTKVRTGVVVLLGCAVIFVSGCFFLEGDLRVNVDGSSQTELRVGINAALAQMGGEDKLSAEKLLEEARKNLPKGWTAKPLEREGWQGIVISGRAAAGEMMLPQAPVKVRVVRRLLSTDYVIEGVLSPAEVAPAGATEGTASATPGRLVLAANHEANDERAEAQDDEAEEKRMEAGEDGEEEGGGQEMPFNPEALQGLMGALQLRVSLTIRAPGTVLETNGQLNDEGAVVWAIDLSQMIQGEAPEDLHLKLHTRLLNHQSIGRLADRLAAEFDSPDMASVIADCVSRDLLPNPRRDNPLEATLDAGAYHAALNIVGVLDEALGEEITDRVIRGLELNSDKITGQRLRQVWDKLQDVYPDELVEVAAQAATRHLEGALK